jgi:transcriptional regulator GlxA family with amidase domain
MAGGLDAAGPSGGAVRNTTISSPTVAITAISSSWSKTLQSQFARGVVSTISGWPRGYFKHIAGYTVSEDGLELNNCCVELTDRVRTSTRESSRAIPMNRGSKRAGNDAVSTKSPLSAAGPRHVVLLAVPPIIELDLVGPLNVFQGASRLSIAPGDVASGARAYRVTVASAGENRVIAGECDIQLIAHRHYSELDESIDTLLVIGGTGISEHSDPSLSEWLRSQAPRTRRLGSVCLGAFCLAAAGLLNDRRAATHWGWAEELGRSYPQIKVDPERIWVRDGAIYTSAGVTAGIDLALALVEEDVGSRIALQIARTLVVFLKRPGGQRQFSAPLAAQTPSTRSFADLIAWIAENLHRSLTVELLAERMSRSPRNFARLFRVETGATPATYIRRARIEAVRMLLEQSKRRLEDIAARCGFGDVEAMRRAFLSDVGVTPGQYRETFSTERKRPA